MKKIIFLHIPKAGGSTFNKILEDQYKGKKIHTLKYLDIDEFKALSKSRIDEIDVLKGHIPFGLDKFFNEKRDYITFLRDPVKRMVSYYYYILDTPQHYLHTQIKKENMTIEEFLNSNLTGEIDNGQIRFLTDTNDLKEELGEVQLQKAISNLKEQIFFGITEKFDESLIYISNKLAWNKPPYYIRQNVAKSKPTINSKVLELIAKRNKWDIKLYEWANSYFEEQCKEIESFDSKLISFKVGKEEYSESWEATSTRLKETLKKGFRKIFFR